MYYQIHFSSRSKGFSVKSNSLSEVSLLYASISLSDDGIESKMLEKVYEDNEFPRPAKGEILACHATEAFIARYEKDSY